MESFVMQWPPKVICGGGSFAALGEETARFGRKAMVVTGRGTLGRAGLEERLQQTMKEAGVEYQVVDGVRPEARLEDVDMVRNHLGAAEVVVAIGGGSTLDVGKAAAGLAYSDAATADFFYGRRKVDRKGLPWIGVPTTAGTGAEVTKNSVLLDEEGHVKQSIRSDLWFAALALVDYELTMTMPPEVTASTGLDAFTQAVEAHTSRGANEATRFFSGKAAELLGKNLRQAYADGQDRAARAAVARGSLYAGIALANARLGLVHGLAHPLGESLGMPHGLVCGILLPHVVEFNLETAAGEYAELAKLLGLTGEGQSAAESFLRFCRQLTADLALPTGLAGFARGVTVDMDRIVELTLASGSTKANPKEAAAEGVAELVTKLLET